MNAGIQGLAADIFKVALVRLDRALEERAGSPAGSSSRSTTRCSSTSRSTSTTGPPSSPSRPWPAPPTSRAPRGQPRRSARPGPTPRDDRPDLHEPAQVERSAEAHWFEPLADHLGAAYLRYSFTKGTEQEVGSSSTRSGSSRACGCSTSAAGRAATPTPSPRRGIEVVRRRHLRTGSSTWPPQDAPDRRDLRAARRPGLAFDAEFDAAISLCQGAFGLVGPGPDEEVLAGMVRAAPARRPGRRQRLLRLLPVPLPDRRRPSTPPPPPPPSAPRSRTRRHGPAGRAPHHLLHAPRAAAARRPGRARRRRGVERRARRLPARPRRPSRRAEFLLVGTRPG